MADSKEQKPNISGASSSAVGLRKRQQIAASNKTMFLWVAGASVVVAFAIVISIFLVKQIMFSEKILIEKRETVSTLEKNIKSAKELDKNVNKLRANKNLSQLRNKASSNSLDVIIDALPYRADKAALGASLQKVLLTDASIDALDIESEEGASSDLTAVQTEQVGTSEPMTFTFKVTGGVDQIKAVLDKLNKSIRPIVITSFQVESAGGNNLTASIQASTYYQPARQFELTEKVIKP